MRDFDSVLGDMLGTIPEGEAQELREKLEHIKQGAIFQPPEGVWGNYGARVRDVLFDTFGKPPTEGWRCEMVSIFRGKP